MVFAYIMIALSRNYTCDHGFTESHALKAAAIMAVTQRKFFVGGNWKMNGNRSSIDGIMSFLSTGALSQDAGDCNGNHALPRKHYINWHFTIIMSVSAEVVVAPPSLYLQYVIGKLPSSVTVAGQNCYKAEKGAFTGEIRLRRTLW